MLNNDKIRIEYCAWFNSSGYGCAAQNYIRAIEQTNKFDIKINIFGDKIDKRSFTEDDYFYFYNLLKKNDKNDDRILIYHCIPTIQRRIKKNKKSIGFATFETFSPPEKWAEILNENDAIITPSKFNYNIFSHMNISKPIYYIPHCLDMNRYSKDINPLYNYDKFTFLFMGIWRERKGYKQLLEAWFKEFTNEDNVQLIIKTDKIKTAKEYIEKIKISMGVNNKRIAPIIFENNILDELQLIRFIKSCNCLISCHSGEGFFIPGLQCMSLGVPIIVTDFSGSQDFANDDNSFLIKPDGFVFCRNMDNIPQFANKKWAYLDVNKIRKTMRLVFTNKKLVEEKVNKAYENRNIFNYDNIGKMFLNMVNDIYG